MRLYVNKRGCVLKNTEPTHSVPIAVSYLGRVSAAEKAQGERQADGHYGVSRNGEENIWDVDRHGCVVSIQSTTSPNKYPDRRDVILACIHYTIQRHLPYNKSSSSYIASRTNLNSLSVYIQWFQLNSRACSHFRPLYTSQQERITAMPVFKSVTLH